MMMSDVSWSDLPVFFSFFLGTRRLRLRSAATAHRFGTTQICRFEVSLSNNYRVP